MELVVHLHRPARRRTRRGTRPLRPSTSSSIAYCGSRCSRISGPPVTRHVTFVHTDTTSRPHGRALEHRVEGARPLHVAGVTPVSSAISSIASGDNQPSWSCARCASGRIADFGRGYCATISLRARAVRVREEASPVDLAHDRVDARDDRDRVGDEAAVRHRLDRLQVVEGRPADVHAHRLPRSVAHEVAADLAAR